MRREADKREQEDPAHPRGALMFTKSYKEFKRLQQAKALGQVPRGVPFRQLSRVSLRQEPGPPPQDRGGVHPRAEHPDHIVIDVAEPDSSRSSQVDNRSGNCKGARYKLTPRDFLANAQQKASEYPSWSHNPSRSHNKLESESGPSPQNESGMRKVKRLEREYSQALSGSLNRPRLEPGPPAPDPVEPPEPGPPPLAPLEPPEPGPPPQDPAGRRPWPEPDPGHVIIDMPDMEFGNQPESSKSHVTLIIIVSLLVVTLAGAAAWLLFFRDPSKGSILDVFTRSADTTKNTITGITEETSGNSEKSVSFWEKYKYPILATGGLAAVVGGAYALYTNFTGQHNPDDLGERGELPIPPPNNTSTWTLDPRKWPLWGQIFGGAATVIGATEVTNACGNDTPWSPWKWLKDRVSQSQSGNQANSESSQSQEELEREVEARVSDFFKDHKFSNEALDTLVTTLKTEYPKLDQFIDSAVAAEKEKIQPGTDAATAVSKGFKGNKSDPVSKSPKPTSGTVGVMEEKLPEVRGSSKNDQVKVPDTVTSASAPMPDELQYTNESESIRNKEKEARAHEVREKSLQPGTIQEHDQEEARLAAEDEVVHARKNGEKKLTPAVTGDAESDKHSKDERELQHIQDATEATAQQEQAAQPEQKQLLAQQTDAQAEAKTRDALDSHHEPKKRIPD